MQISVLMDDNASESCFSCEHGLSLYLTVPGFKILFDTGASGLFLENARRLGINISDTDFVVLSHGHSDHGGGLRSLWNACPKARVFMQTSAVEPHFTRRTNGVVEFIGLDNALKQDPRVISYSGDLHIGDRITMFPSTGEAFWRPETQNTLLTGIPDALRPDSFHHEQNLLYCDSDSAVLIAGCAHRGILNILQKAVELAGRPMDAVIGGFHLSNPRDGGCIPQEKLNTIIDVMLQYPATTYYTCHCTGPEAFDRMHQKMGDRIRWIGAGSQFRV